MTEEDAGASPPIPKKFKTESEKQPAELSKDKSHPEEEEEEDSKEIEEPQMFKTESEEEQMELSKDEDHSEKEESKEIEEDEDDDGPPPGWRHSPTSSPPLLDMIDFPPSLTLPPTPPLPSSPTDLEMEQQDSDEDDGPPPGWDTKYQLNEQAGQLAATSAISSDIQTEDVQQAAHDEEGEPRLQAHSCLPPEVAPSVEEQEHDSEDDGPPPGWDSKCQPEPKLQEVPQSDTKMEDVLQDGHNEEGQPTPEVPSDIIADPEDSDDEGPPPGWDSKCHPKPESQKTLQSDIKTNHVQQDAQNENDPQSQSQSQPQSRSSPAPELVPSEEQDSEDDGPPPGWNSKCPVEPNLQTARPTTPPSDFKIEEDKEQSHVHSSLPSPIVQSGTGYEPNSVKTIEEIPQPPSRQQSIHHTAEITVPKRPTTMNNHEMGQMVCGSCRHLLSYPRGARYVECACCLVENYVLEEHEVGQVVCGSCNVLLIYPYGAPKVRCATCRAETEIRDQNRRPPLSEHKRRARQHMKRVQAG